MTTPTDQVVTSFEELAAALEDQFLVAFEAPVALPAVASVGVGARNAAMSSTTLVRLPDPDPDPDPGTGAVGSASTRDSPLAADALGALPVLAIVFVVAGLLSLALLLRVRRRAGPRPAPTTPPPPTMGRTATSAALFEHGRRQNPAQPPLASLLSRAGPQASATSTGKQRPILRGHGDGVVMLRKMAPGPAAVHITGNAPARFFGVRTLGSDTDVLNTIDPYDGVRALDWDGPETTGFEVRATGSWTIQVVPVTAIPTFDRSFAGTGDMVLRFAGGASTATITGNDAGRYFSARLLGDSADHRASVRVFTATEPFSGSFAIPDGHCLIAVEAVGPWTLSVP